jgi:sugar fermentation stimulation protein A
VIFDPPLRPATLIQRYKRFLADVRFPDGSTATAHVANSGKMLGVDAPGATVWLSPAPPTNKLPWRLHFVETPTSWAGVDTSIPNKLVGEALRAGAIPALAAYTSVRAEVKYGAASRIDFLLEQAGLPPCYVEVKNCHLSRNPRLAEFPDCAAARSAKHMHELTAMVKAGARAVTLIVVQRTDCDRFTPAADLDPVFAQAFQDARGAGVEAMAWACAMGPGEVRLAREIAVQP